MNRKDVPLHGGCHQHKETLTQDDLEGDSGLIMTGK